MRLTFTRLAALAFTLLPLAASAIEQRNLALAADTYIQRGSSTIFGTGTTFLVKRDFAATSGGTDRIGYLRFTTPASTPTTTAASLVLTITSYPGDTNGPFAFEIFGLPDSHPDEAFDSATFNFTSAANAATNAPGSFNSTGLVSLGVVSPATSTAPQTLTLSTAALRDFIAQNTNTHLTFAILRQTPNTGLPSYFASGESATLAQRPTLLILLPDGALPSTATASSTLGTDTPALAVDGDFATRWTAAADTNSATTRSLTLDLGASVSVNRFTFTAYQHGRTLRLEHSTNGTTWTTIMSGFRSGTDTSVNTLQTTTTRYFQPVSARYLRLSSLGGVSGTSLSVREAAAYLDSAATPTLTRLASLASSVAALTSTVSAEQLRRVVLDVALERAQAALNASDFTLANQLLDDVQTTLATSASTLAAPAVGVPNLAVLRPLDSTAATSATNPYLARLVAGIDLATATAETRVWEKSTPTWNEFADFSFARTTGAELDTLFWLFAHPSSPRRHNPEILRRALRRAYAYLDAIAVHGGNLDAAQLASFYDDFAIGPASQPFRELPSLYPNLLPPAQKNLWQSAVITAGDKIYDTHRDRLATWVNTDVAISCELFNLALPRPAADPQRAAMLAKATYFMSDVLTSGRMFADGAVGYHDSQNEAGGYQNTVAEYVTRYFEMTGDADAGEILRRMEWYGPINGPIHSWWTSPAWKLAWNDIDSSDHGGESIAGRTPYVRAELDAAMNVAASSTNWVGVQRAANWYRPGITPLPRPDYTVFDRNILGPRAWYGSWNYAATLRRTDDIDPGLHTLMGAQVTDASPFRVNACLMGVFPRLRVSPDSGTDADGTFAETRHAWLATGLSGAAVVRRDFSSLAASHRLETYASSSKGAVQPWTARQLWLGLPDRVVGLLTLAPDVDTTAYEVQGALRLGFGGTAYSATKTLTPSGTSGNAWTYGDLLVRLHGHDYAAVTTDTYAFRVAAAPITEITFRDQIDGKTNTVARPYLAGARRFFIAEIRNRTATGDITATEVAAPAGLLAFEVDHPTAGRRFRIVYNPTAAAITYTPTLAWSGPIRLHLAVAQSSQLPAWQSTLAHFRPSWMPDPTGGVPSIYWTAPAAVEIPPQGHVVFEGGGDLAPAAPTVALLTASDTGSSNTDRITKNTTPTLRVTLVGTGANAPLAGDVARVYQNATQIASATLVAGDIGAGFIDVTTGVLAAGSLSFTANVTDAASNVSADSAALAVTLDTTAPVISLNGSASTTSPWGTTYSDANATAADSVDGTVSVSTVNPVVSSTPGTYTVTYNASDAAGNNATQVSRTVTVAIANALTTGADALTPLMKYAFGATGPNDTVQSPVTGTTATELSITAVVRTNDTNLAVAAESNTDLTASGAWTTAGVTETVAANQTNLPAYCQRKVFTVTITGASKKFLRLKAVGTF